MPPIRIDRVSAEQHAAVDRANRTARDGRLRVRALIVLLAAERGMVAAEIAAVVRMHGETVRRWLMRYQAEGLEGLPFSFWPGDRLSDYLVERTGVRMSRASVYRLLRAGGVHRNRPQHTITRPDPEYAAQKRRWRAPATVRSPARCSTTPTSSTSPGTRPSARSGQRGASR